MGLFFRDKKKGGSRPPYQGGKHYGGHRYPGSEEKTIRSERVMVEHKMFYLLLKENMRGKFLRVTEESNGKSDTIIIPSTGLADFRDAINLILESCENSEEQSQEYHQEPVLYIPRLCHSPFLIYISIPGWSGCLHLHSCTFPQGLP